MHFTEQTCSKENYISLWVQVNESVNYLDFRTGCEDHWSPFLYEYISLVNHALFEIVIGNLIALSLCKYTSQLWSLGRTASCRWIILPTLELVRPSSHVRVVRVRAGAGACLCVCMHECVPACLCECVCMSVCLRACVCVYGYLRCACVHVCVCARACLPACVLVCQCAIVRVCMHGWMDVWMVGVCVCAHSLAHVCVCVALVCVCARARVCMCVCLSAPQTTDPALQSEYENETFR